MYTGREETEATPKETTKKEIKEGLRKREQEQRRAVLLWYTVVFTVVALCFDAPTEFRQLTVSVIRWWWLAAAFVLGI